MNGIFRFLAAVVVGGTAGVMIALPIAVTGLVVPMYLIWPLSLGSAALAASPTAGWISNLLSGDRSRLLAVIGVTEAVAVVLSISMLMREFSLLKAATSAPMIYPITGCVIVIAFSSGIAALLLRGPRERMNRDTVLTITLLIALPLLVDAVLLFSCSTTVRCIA